MAVNKEAPAAALVSQTFNQYDAAPFITAVKNMQKAPSAPTRYEPELSDPESSVD